MHTHTHQYTDTIACLACCSELVLPTHCDTLQGTATHCNMQTHTCKQQQTVAVSCLAIFKLLWTHTNNECSGVLDTRVSLNTLTSKDFFFCNARTQTTAHRCSGVLGDLFWCNSPKHTATHCNTLQHTATHCNMPTRTRKQQHTDAVACLANFFDELCLCPGEAGVLWEEVMRSVTLSGQPLQVICMCITYVYACTYMYFWMFLCMCKGRAPAVDLCVYIVYICVFNIVYVCIFVYTHICIYLQARVYMYINICIFTCVRNSGKGDAVCHPVWPALASDLHVYIVYMYMCIYMYTYVWVYLCEYINVIHVCILCTCMYMCMYMCVYICMGMCIYTYNVYTYVYIYK